jgi:hypothetical protein
MKAVRTEIFPANGDVDLTKLALREAFTRILDKPMTSTTHSNLTVAILHDDDSDNKGMVLAAVTLSARNLTGIQAARAYQDLTRDIPGLTARISAGKFLVHLSVESDQ